MHSPIERYALQHKINIKNLKPHLLTIRPGNGAGLVSKEKISREEISKEKVKKKKISWEAYDINKQTIYAPRGRKKEPISFCVHLFFST